MGKASHGVKGNRNLEISFAAGGHCSTVWGREIMDAPLWKESYFPWAWTREYWEREVRKGDGLERVTAD